MFRISANIAISFAGVCAACLVWTASAYARCAFVAVQVPFATPSIAPGRTSIPCFDLNQRCNRRYGCFKTALRLGRNFVAGRAPPMKRLEARFGYIDPDGLHWDVPTGYLTDGASIPPGLKPIIGSSWNRHYIRAAVIHDYYIDHAKKTASAKAVHRVFFHALLASGVQPYWAHWMYRAVSKYGPQWKTIDLARNRQIRIDNERARAKFNREFSSRYKRCLNRRQARLRQPPLNRSLRCPLKQADELLYSLAEVTVDAVRDAVGKQRQGKCRLGADGISDCGANDYRRRSRRQQ